MNELISPEYLELQHEMHHRYPGSYGTTMPRHLLLIKWGLRNTDAKTVLDYGSGPHTHAKRLLSKSHQVQSYDPCVPTLADEPEPADFVICTDVLEHIEPDKIDAVLDHLFSKMRLGAFVSISLRVAQKQLADGRNAHILLRPIEWWQEELNKRCRISNTAVFPEREALFHCRPR